MPLTSLGNDEAFEFYRSFLEFHCKWSRPGSYLELGLAEGVTFRRLIPFCDQLTGVDPRLPEMPDRDPKCRLFAQTSDGFFRDHPDERYDLGFIDGLHEHRQVLRDIRNSLARLNPQGVVMAHDTFPSSVELTNSAGCGDAYKALIELRQDRSLEVYTFPATYGLSLIGKIGVDFPWIDPSRS